MKPVKQLFLLALLTASYWLIAARSSDVLADLGIGLGKLQQDVLLNLKEPKWFFFNSTSTIRTMARRLPESSRAATVRTLGKTVRTYVESSVFRQEWLQDLKQEYPYNDAYSPENLAKKKQEHDAGKVAAEGQLANMDQAFAQLDPAMLQMGIRSQLPEEERKIASLSGDERTERTRYIADLKKMLSLPAADFKKQYLAYLKQQARGNMAKPANDSEADREGIARYRQQKAEFDAHADFKPLLKKRLQDFIELSNSVDFEARLVPMGSKQEFANPLYQRKPAEWKFLYRLGKEPVAEARSFAQQWLADLH
ncbi:hypothetical protein G8759_08550 [Spirosoma aureum]|uniref:DUF885 domain-containing protein n=1 Tax=Spirosoma aureum TaxID=2692134 RepID=A0A6G9AJP4_9BACT|nr:hypothetical protein [Spirosoma aureum]QIP12670.1 hypothetical protein G8759_08550 [Spirosoma aureum]